MIFPMNFPLSRCVLTGSALAFMSPAVSAADSDPGCNQMGREVALRAAEQMQAGLDTAARTELAAIAEAVCIEFTVSVGSAAAPSRVAAAPAAEPGTVEASEQREAFGLEIIPPEERVRRPGLKRL